MIDDKILDFFRRCGDAYVSGEELSQKLSISRTAVWKHIEKLREEGYEIEASPHLGYKLLHVPDRLIESELKWQLGTQIIGRRIFSYKELESTNDTAYKLAQEGEKEGGVVIAEYQTKGRGRLGRRWISPRGKGAYISIILRPDILPREVALITLISALSVAQATRKVFNLMSFIKWPNDVLINKKKVCGILTEMSAEVDKINFVIVGIGININAKKELLPDGATSIFEEKKKEVSSLEFIKELFRILELNYKIFYNEEIEALLKQYRELSSVLGERVRVNYNNQILEGSCVDVDREGALILRRDSGLCERVLAGDVVMLRQ